MEPMLLLCRKVKTFSFLQFQNLSPKTEVDPSPKDKTELLPLMGLLFRRRLPFPKGEEDGFQPSVRRTRDQELKLLDFLFLNGHPIFLAVDDLFFRGLPEEIGDILVQGIEELDQAVQGDGRQIPFDLGDKPLGQIGPLGEFLLRQVAQLSQIANSFSNFHKSESTVYEEIGLIMCKTV